MNGDFAPCREETMDTTWTWRPMHAASIMNGIRIKVFDFLKLKKKPPQKGENRGYLGRIPISRQ